MLYTKKRKFLTRIIPLVLLMLVVETARQGATRAVLAGEVETRQSGVDASGESEGRIVLVPVVSYRSRVDDLDAAGVEDFFKENIFISEKALKVLPKSNEGSRRYRQASDVYSLIEKNPGMIGLVRLDELKPGLRVVSVNGIYFYEIEKKYLLTLNPENPQAADDEPGQIFTFAQTGVTALTRGLIQKIARTGNPLYITEKIAPFLRQFDLTHASNEVSFAEECKFVPSTMLFCSPLSYFQILRESGFDIIELTGNHNNDYGYPAANFTMELYRKHQMRFFGGGKDLDDSRAILYLDVEKKFSAREPGKKPPVGPVKKAALIGYNEANVFYRYDLPLAKKTSPGANPFELQKMRADIALAKKTADTVIVDFQFAECDAYKPGSNDDCYQPMKNPDQRGVFQAAVDAGADIVVGTQAHQPQVIENYKGGVIFYGLGNLYFDQVRWEGTRQGMVLVHVFFKGKYKTTVVHPTYFDENLQVYLPSGEKKKSLLDIYYRRAAAP